MSQKTPPPTVQLPEPIWILEFNNSALQQFTREFMKAEQDPNTDTIIVHVSSFGGLVHNYFAMRDIMKSSTKRVCTVALGKAMSGGAFILASGTKGLRFASPNTEIMVHEIQSGSVGNVTEINKQTEDLNKLNNRLLKMLAEDTGKSVKFWKQQLKTVVDGDLSLDAEQAQKLGLIDVIGTPRLLVQETTPVVGLGVTDLVKSKKK